MQENIMNGKWYTLNDPPVIGAGKSIKAISTVFNATLNDLEITMQSYSDHCTLNWDACDGADRYRMDLYHIEDRGPYMNNLCYVTVQSEWTTETNINTIPLKPMNSYHAVVFAYKGEECLGRYEAQYCVVSHATVGDMLWDDTDDYVITNSSLLQNTEINFESLPAEKSVLLNDNPDRGFRTEEIFDIPTEEVLKTLTFDQVFEDIKQKQNKRMFGEKVKICRVYFVLVNYPKTEILPQAVLDYMDWVYEAYKRLGIKIYLCHFYVRDPDTTPHPTTEVLLSHLTQLKPLFEKHKDSLYAANFTFLGRYGEWTCLRTPLDLQAFVNAFMDAMPKEVRLIFRDPGIKERFINKEYWRYPLIGFADDACHGLMFNNIDLGQGNNQPGSEEWARNVKESPYTVNDTELFTTRWIRLSGSWPDGYSCMESLSQKHICSLSMEHGYTDIYRFGGRLAETCLSGWKGQEVTREVLNKLGLAASPSWFTDKNGNYAKRNVFEYLRDHVGYRLSAEKLSLNVNEKEIEATVFLKNYGYAAGFNLKSKLVILDKKGNPISEVSFGNPEEWYGTKPEPYEDRELLCHTISAKLPKPDKNGTYSLALRLENSLGQTARLDNKIAFVNGNNILYSFNIGE